MKAEPQKLTYYRSLDGVRGIAALMIMFLHFMPNYDRNINPVLFFFKKASIVGQCGVPLFFVLSGYLISRILINTKYDKNYFSSFYFKRSLRIFPLYYLFLTICFLVIPFFNHEIISWGLCWPYVFYLQNIFMTFNWKSADIPHLWSLAVEEQFYLIWPLIIYFTSLRSLKIVITGIIIFAIACRIIMVYNGIGVYYFTFATFDALAIGAFLALNEYRKWLTKRAVITVTIVLLVLLISIFPFLTGSGLPILQYFKNTAISLFCASVIWVCINLKNHLTRFFELPFFVFTGKISYGLYVFHPLVFNIVGKTFHLSNFPLSITLSFLSAYGVATFSYYFFESWFLRLKKYAKSKED